MLHIESFVSELAFPENEFFLFNVGRENIYFKVDARLFAVDFLHGFAPIARRVVYSERQKPFFVEYIQVVKTELFERARGEIVKIVFDIVIPNAVYILVFKVG